MFSLICGVISEAVGDGILGIFLIIDSVIYWAVSKLYGLFIDIASARIFDQDVISALANRIYSLVGVIMLFVVAYALLTAIVDPSKMSKGEMSTGKLAKNTIISIIIVAVVPTIFNFAYKAQQAIITENILGRVLLGQGAAGDYDSVRVELDVSNLTDQEKSDMLDKSPVEYDPNTGKYVYIMDATSNQAKANGNIMAFGVLNAFLNPENVNVKVKATKSGRAERINSATTVGGYVLCGGGIILAVGSAIASWGTGIPVSVGIAAAACAAAGTASIASGQYVAVVGEETDWVAIKDYVESSGDFIQLSRMSDPVVNKNITYMPVISTICGLLLLYVVLSFCLDLGVRAVKLVFYQLIAPIPIMLRIVPKQEKVFSNWLKCTLSTFFEVFVRLAVIYTITYLASNLTHFELDRLGMFGKAIIIMGLVAFAKQAPKLIGEVTGIKSDGLKLGIRDKLAAGGALAAGAAIGGGLVAGLRNGVNAYKGAEGGKGKKIAAAFRSGIAGAGSGAIRSGYGARNAKSYADIGKSINAGATAANKKATKRANFKKNHAQGYKAAYDSSKATTKRGKIVDALKGGVIGGHIYNAGESVAQYFGLINNIDSARAETQIAADFTKAAKTISATADDYIGKHLDQFYAASVKDKDGKTGNDYLKEKLEFLKENGAELAALDKIIADSTSSPERKADAQRKKNDLEDKLKKIDEHLDSFINARLDILKVTAETPAQTEALQSRIQDLKLSLTNGEAVRLEKNRIDTEINKLSEEIAKIDELPEEKLTAHESRMRVELVTKAKELEEKKKTVDKDVKDRIDTEIANITKLINEENVKASQAARDYSLAMKNSRDNFANTVQYLEGAEAEKRDVNASYEIINDLLKTNKTSATVAAIYGGSKELGVKGLDDLPADDIALRVKAVSKMSEDSASRASALVAEYERRERDKKEGK